MSLTSPQQKKTARQNSNPGSLTSPGPSTNLQQAGARFESTEFTPMFSTEVSDIMRGYGDAEDPLPETVALVEKITWQQLRVLVNEATRVALQRPKGKAAPQQRDFEYLMRRHPQRIHRFQKHLKHLRCMKDLQLRKNLAEVVSQSRHAEALTKENSDEETDRVVDELYDHEKTRRIFRADRISQILNGAQYLKFNDARKASFFMRNSSTMRNRMQMWLALPASYVLSTHICTCLAYFAHETIATIVDSSILTRLDSDNRTVQPFDRVTSSGTSYSMLGLCPEVTQGRGVDGAKHITVREVYEVMRRHTLMSTRKMGQLKRADREHVLPLLVL